MAGELTINVRPDFVAFPADRWSEMNAQFGGGKAALRERLDSTLDDPCRRAAPTGVQDGNGASGMGDEHWHTIRHAYDERDSTIAGRMPIGIIDAEPAFPIRGVNDDSGTVNLSGGGQSHAPWFQFLSELSPAAHHFADRLLGRQAEGSACTRRRERSNTKGSKVVDRLRLRDDAHDDRRSSTRSILAPSARKRSSIRS